MLEKSKMAISFDTKGSIESLLYNGKQFITNVKLALKRF